MQPFNDVTFFAAFRQTWKSRVVRSYCSSPMSSISGHLFRRFWRVALCFCLALPLALSAVNSPEFTSRTWQTGDGLPHNTVYAVAQTLDGYLWIGTHAGLARFDGIRFIVYDTRN